MDLKKVGINVIQDFRGKLVSLEAFKNVPFDIKRVYCIFDTAIGTTRGKHAHTKLEQLIVCLRGNCTFLLDDGAHKKCVKLNTPKAALYIGRNIWREMYDFSSDCILMVLASDFYDEDEYIRDYDEFLKICGTNGSMGHAEEQAR